MFIPNYWRQRKQKLALFNPKQPGAKLRDPIIFLSTETENNALVRTLARQRVKFTMRCLRSLTRVLKDISLEPDPEFEPSNFACANFEVWSLHMRGL